jgi:ATP adenylyltransferase
MHRLWAPWRHAYVSAAAGSGAGAGGEACFLCEAPGAGDDAGRGIVWRWKSWYAIQNAYPYTNGHLMLALYRHHEGFTGLEPGESAELAPALAVCEAAVRAAYAPGGLNLGVNLGRVAGAGAVGHLHVHLVPRWNGDTNFMTTTAETRVLPEDLASSYGRLRTAFEQCTT